MFDLIKKKKFKFDIGQNVNFKYPYEAYFVFGTIIDRKFGMFGSTYYRIKYRTRYNDFKVVWVKEKNVYVSTL